MMNKQGRARQVAGVPCTGGQDRTVGEVGTGARTANVGARKVGSKLFTIFSLSLHG